LVVRPTCVREMDIVEFAQERLGFEPDERQVEVLRSEGKRGILNCTRQWGKTTVAAAKVVHRVYTRPDNLVLVASPTLRQSCIFMRSAARMLLRLGLPIRGDGENDISLELPNRSRIVGLPHMPDHVRGFSSVSMLVIDEAAYVSDEMYMALRPMLATSGGDLWMMSTPNGKNGFFYDTWQHGGERWDRIRVPATECPRIPTDFLEEEREAIPGTRFAQEYMCEFVGRGLNLFDRELVEAALDDGVEAWEEGVLRSQPNLPAWMTARADQFFIVALDLGKIHDHSAYVICEYCQGELLIHAGERVPLGTPYTDVVEIMRKVLQSPRLRQRCTLVVDASGVGEPVVEMLRRADLGCGVTPVKITPGVMARAGRSSGYQHVPKLDLMAGLQVALQEGTLKIAKKMKNAGSLVKGLMDVRVRVNGSMGADGAGKHDDLVIAVALACWRAKRGQNDWGGGGAIQ
jgi:phage FluMu gp28-like protein